MSTARATNSMSAWWQNSGRCRWRSSTWLLWMCDAILSSPSGRERDGTESVGYLVPLCAPKMTRHRVPGTGQGKGKVNYKKLRKEREMLLSFPGKLACSDSPWVVGCPCSWTVPNVRCQKGGCMHGLYRTLFLLKAKKMPKMPEYANVSRRMKNLIAAATSVASHRVFRNHTHTPARQPALRGSWRESGSENRYTFVFACSWTFIGQPDSASTKNNHPFVACFFLYFAGIIAVHSAGLRRSKPHISRERDMG